MKRLALLALMVTAAGAAEIGKPDFNDDDFAKRFTASYGFLSTREPVISPLEQVLLEKMAAVVNENPGKARIMLESSVEGGKPISAAFNHILGNLYVTNKNLDQAEEQYREAIRKFPDFQRAWNSLGTLKMEREDYAGAITALSKSVELGASDAQTYGMLGYALLQTRSFAAAEVAYNLALLRQPDSVRWLEGKARILSDAGRHEETLAATDELLKRSPGNIEYWRLQASAHLSLGHTAEAARSLEVARSMGPLDAAALYTLGNIYLKSGMVESALDAYLAAISLEPNPSPSVMLRIAHSLIGQEQYDLARRLLATLSTNVAEWAPKEQVLDHLLLGRIALHDGATDKAVAALERALALDPTNAEVLYRLAVVQADHGQPEKARYLLEKIKDDPNYEYGAQLFIAKMLVGQSHFDEALGFLRSAYRLRPSAEVETLYNRVRIAAESMN